VANFGKHSGSLKRILGAKTTENGRKSQQKHLVCICKHIYTIFTSGSLAHPSGIIREVWAIIPECFPKFGSKLRKFAVK